MKTSVVYPPKSTKAIGQLKTNNDIDIYVEDSSNPKMWVLLLKKYIPDDIRLESVTPLGGRKNVIEACKEDQSDDRKKLYIIDADLDLIQGAKMPNLNYLYRLRAYSVENYLIHERAILEVINIWKEHIDIESAENSLNFSSWLDGNLQLMTPLFISYATHDYLLTQQRIPTVSCSVFNLTKPQALRDSLCPDKTSTKIKYVDEQTCKVVGANNLKECLVKFTANIKSMNEKDVVSAKDYILPLLFERIKRIFSVNISRKVFLNMLADKSDVKYDPKLTSCLKKICSKI